MDALENMIARVEKVRDGFESGRYVADALATRSSMILEYQKGQLASGKDSEGNDLQPSYLEDLQPKGHFYSVESAKRYSDWKQTITPPNYRGGSGSRQADTPNLYITGKFYDELGVFFSPDDVTIEGITSYAQNIIDKYGLEKFGLTSENWQEIMDNGVKEDIFNQMLIDLQ